MDPQQADPANQDQDPALTTTGEGAGTDDAQQPAGDPAPPRSQDEGQAPDASDDASQDTTDPLILAQLEPTPNTEPKAPAPAAAKPTTAPPAEPAVVPQGKAPEKPKATTEPEAEEDDPNANLPDEDWQKLSHKSKSQFLTQRKSLKRANQVAAEKAAEAEAARKQVALHEKFVRDHGLSNEDFTNGVAVVGAVNRGDPEALPILEDAVNKLRTRLGIQPPAPPAPAAPAVDVDEVLKLIEEAEGNLDFTKLNALSAKLKSAKQTPPPAAPPAQPAAPPASNQPPRAPAHAGDVELMVNASIGDYLVAEGVKQDQVLPYLRELIQDIRADAARQGRQGPGVSERLRAVMAAHRARQARAQQPPPKPTSAPLSGRGRPVVTRSPTTATNADPLKHAMPQRGR